VYFDNMALYFECRMNKIALLQTDFDDFSHWEATTYFIIIFTFKKLNDLHTCYQ